MAWLRTVRDRCGRVTSELRTWAGSYRFTARQVIAARTVDDVRRAVAAGAPGGRVRALGTRHSFNDLADNGATLVTVTGIPPDPVLDETARTVTAGAGTSYGALAAWLQRRGWALATWARCRTSPSPARSPREPTVRAAATRFCRLPSLAWTTWTPAVSYGTPGARTRTSTGCPSGWGRSASSCASPWM